MTIREHYESVAKRIKYGTVAAIVAVAIAFPWLYHGPRKREGLIWLLTFAVFGPVLVVLSRILYRCPRCHADFQKLRINWRLRDACPQCNVSFDEPWDGTSR